MKIISGNEKIIIEQIKFMICFILEKDSFLKAKSS